MVVSLRVPVLAATACGDLAKLTLLQATVHSAETIGAGEFSPPSDPGQEAPLRPEQRQQLKELGSFCRVRATLAPSGDSSIKIEVWLPISGWNGNFQGVVAGGLAGYIPYQLMGPALRAGYAVAGTDTGHEGPTADFMPEHPERLIDFAHRAVHEMAEIGRAHV